MAENKIEKLAELLGVEIDKPILSDSEKRLFRKCTKTF